MNNKVKISLFMLMVSYTVLTHLPTFRYQCCADTYFISDLSLILLDYGHINWYDSNLSLFGYFPYSYPTGMPVILSSLFLLTGLEINYVVYVFSLFLSLIIPLVMFCFIQNTFTNRRMAFLSMFIVSTVPFIHQLTWFNGHARSLATLFFLLIIFYCSNRLSRKSMFLLFFTAFALISSHRIGLIGIILISLILFVSYLFNRYSLGPRFTFSLFALSSSVAFFLTFEGDFTNYRDIFNFAVSSTLQSFEYFSFYSFFFSFNANIFVRKFTRL